MKKFGMALVVSAFVMSSAPAYAADDHDYSCPLLWPVYLVKTILHIDK